MISREEAVRLMAAMVEMPIYEKIVDDSIRLAILAGKQDAKTTFSNETAALAVRDRYRLNKWPAEVAWTGSDRTYSPHDEWTLVISLRDL